MLVFRGVTGFCLRNSNLRLVGIPSCLDCWDRWESWAGKKCKKYLWSLGGSHTKEIKVTNSHLFLKFTWDCSAFFLEERSGDSSGQFVFFRPQD